MTLRLTTTSTEHGTVVQVDGRLRGDGPSVWRRCATFAPRAADSSGSPRTSVF